MILTPEQENILEGKQGKTRQKAIRLLIDLGKAAKAKGKLGQRARFAKTLAKLRRKK